MTQVKICGVTEIEHALAAAEGGADFIGLVFKTGSHRQVTVEKAANIVLNLHNLSPYPAPVGVFGNIPAHEVNKIAEACQLKYVQLSGNEPWEYCQEIEHPIIKAIFVSPENTSYDILKQIEQGYRLLPEHKLIYLLDTGIKGTYGGTGQTFNWEIAKEVSSVFPVFIAGGLTRQNVFRLITEVNPRGVDVSSGVEAQGVKDVQKIKEFIRTVKSYSGSK